LRALLAAVGTRGDVQPALALALELQGRGHGVRLCISPNFVEQASSLGLDAVPMGVEMRAPKDAGAMPKLSPEEIRRLRESMPDLITDQFETVGAAARDCDVIVGANAHQYAGPSIAEQLGIGCVTAVYAPNALPSPDVAPMLAPGEAIDAARAGSIEEQWRNTARAWNERALERINRNRDRLGLGPIDDVLDYTLTDHTWLAADAALAPVPATPGREIFQTGSWVLPDASPLSPEVEAFLERGAPPVFVGFGSMPAAGDAAHAPIAAARALGRRIIVSRGWADLDVDDGGSDCLTIGEANYALLFPRVAAVLHHGGAGTTAAAARAGVPQVITPMFGDQPYWAGRVVALGVGSMTPHGTMTEASLTRALEAACHPDAVRRARTLAAQVGRDGAGIAAQRLEANPQEIRSAS
jgi:vancomycin aglycone glucosyltransferase